MGTALHERAGQKFQVWLQYLLGHGLHSPQSRRGKEDEQPRVGMKMLRGVSQSRIVSSGLVCEISRCEDGEQMLAELSLVAIHGEDHPRWRKPQLLGHVNRELFREKCDFAVTRCPTIVFLRQTQANCSGLAN